MEFPTLVCPGTTAGVQPTEGKADEDIVQKDTAAKAVSPKEVDHAEGGKPVEDGEKAQGGS